MPESGGLVAAPQNTHLKIPSLLFPGKSGDRSAFGVSTFSLSPLPESTIRAGCGPPRPARPPQPPGSLGSAPHPSHQKCSPGTMRTKRSQRKQNGIRELSATSTPTHGQQRGSTGVSRRDCGEAETGGAPVPYEWCSQILLSEEQSCNLSADAEQPTSDDDLFLFPRR